MKRLYLYFIFTHLTLQYLHGQSISSEVISCFGMESSQGNPTINLSSTCGEAVVVSTINPDLNMHAGFQQGMPPVIAYVAEATRPTASWQLFPNPNSGVFFVQLTTNSNELNTGVMIYRVIDQMGRLVQSGTIDYQGAVQLDHVAAGVYTLQIFASNQSISNLPFVVSHSK